jgi:hypothetical protein
MTAAYYTLSPISVVVVGVPSFGLAAFAVVEWMHRHREAIRDFRRAIRNK